MTRRQLNTIYLSLVTVLLCLVSVGYSALEQNLLLSGDVTIWKPREPIIKATSSTDTSTFRSSTYKSKIKIINLDDELNPPANIIASWDIGVSQTGNVMAYIVANQTDNTYYDLYIQGDGHLYANENSQYLFAGLSGVDQINGITKLDVSRVTNMSNMFYSTGANSTIFSLNLGNNFDTSNVTDMSYMFCRTGYNNTSFTLNLGSNFDTSNVTNMSST